MCPGIDCDSPPLEVKASDLEKVHALEQGAEVKMAYRLTDRVLHPNSVERVNVQLAASVSHETTVAALQFYGQQAQHQGFNQTAEFLQMIRTWFNIINVKSPWAHVKRNDSTLKPISSDDQQGIACIEKFGKMMSTWLSQPERWR